MPELIALTDDELRDPELADSLRRGWLLGERAAAASDDSPTPITRIALPVALPASPLRLVDRDPVISIDPSDVAGWAAANPPPPTARPRRRLAWAAGLAAFAAAAAAVPLLGEAWRHLAAPASTASRVVPAPPLLADATPPRAAPAAEEPKPAATPPAQVPEASAGLTVSGPIEAAPPAAVAVPEPAAASAEAAIAAETEPATKPVEPSKAAPPAARGAEPPSRRAAPTATRRVAPARPATPVRTAAAAPARSGEPVTVRPAAFPRSARASARPPGRTPIYLPPAVGLAPLPGQALEPAAPPVAVAPATPGPAAPLAAAASPAGDVAAPPDFMLRANELLSTQIPRLAQRAERMVLRVLVAAGRADEGGSDDDEIRLAASGIRLAPEDPLLSRTAVRESRQFHEGARMALRRGDLAEAVGLQTRAFGANPVDAEIVGALAQLRLRQGPGQAEAARRLALHALTLHDWKYPSGRIEDWNTFAVASALSGHERDARNAWLVALALAGGSERQCRAAIDAYALYGEALRSPVEAMLYRASAAGRATRSRLCEWPPHWSASTR